MEIQFNKWYSCYISTYTKGGTYTKFTGIHVDGAGGRIAYHDISINSTTGLIDNKKINQLSPNLDWLSSTDALITDEKLIQKLDRALLTEEV